MVLALAFAGIAPAIAQDEPPDPPDRFEGRELPQSVANLKLASPLTADGVNLDSLWRGAIDSVDPNRIIVRLRTDAVADLGDVSGGRQSSHKKTVEREQDAFISRVLSIDPSASVLARTQIVLNAVFLDVDMAAMADLAADPAVVRIAPVGNYELVLSDTVPYIGATAVQNMGYDGSGVKVAVLDTGIDYTHANLGGSGNPADYLANDPAIIEAGTFPTAKVVDGYDFVGPNWVGGPATPPLSPDPDPLDLGGHGTHVADIIGGIGGVAPGVDLYAVKVCSDISTACSGVALIQAMEFSLDPDGDGKTKDRVDIINMSLGSLYGQPFDDDLSLAVDNATALGVLTVAAAGNAGDEPFIVDSPGAAHTAIAVAQTHVPSAFLPRYEITAPAGIAGFYDAVFQPWSAPLVAAISAPVLYGDGGGGNLNGCAAFTPGSLAGHIVLVDRGACFFSDKIRNIEGGGGLIGIIGLVAPGAPFPGGFGGGPPIGIPGYMISQLDSNIIKSGLPGTEITFDPSVGVPLISSVVSSSGRGPQLQDFSIKPDIAAPGASVSAQAGTGNGVTPFGGTSGATPMISGAAALLLDGFDNHRGNGNGAQIGPLEMKALLMNNTELNIINNLPDTTLAAIARIGGGEVRVDRAFVAPVAAWDDGAFSGGLSFGYVDVADGTVSLTRTVRIRNYENIRRTLTITPTFRFANDVANGAVTVSAPSNVLVKQGLGRDTLFDVTITINGSLLRDNSMNSGSNGANPGPITEQEYDGYLILEDVDPGHPFQLTIPWHVLPRKAARVVPSTTSLAGGGFPEVVGLNNTGVGTAQNDAFSLLLIDEDLPEGGRGEQAPTPDIAAVGINTFPVPAFFCSAEESFIWAFSVNTHERQTHSVSPGIFWFDLDTDQDGTPDHAVFNYDLAGLGSIADGRNVTWAAPYVNFPNEIGPQSAFFFTEHSTVTGNTVLYICGEQVGLTGTDLLATNVDVYPQALDIYFGGPGDVTEMVTVTPLGEQYFGLPNDIPGNTNDPAGLLVFDFGAFPGNTAELGLLLNTNGDRGGGARGGATEATESLLFLVP
jgi:subtilisin family serine protease